MTTEGFIENLSVSDASHGAGERPAAFPAEAVGLAHEAQQIAQAETQQGAAAVPQSGEQIVAAVDNVVKLPAGTSIEKVEIDGDNLILVQPDGSRIVIEHAALHVPTFVIDDVEIPQEALVAALEASNINVAAGPDGTLTAAAAGSESAGGNFSEAIPGIGDAGPAIDLLPPTALQFGAPEDRQLLAAFDAPNRGPGIEFPPQGEGGAGGIDVLDQQVNEAFLDNGTHKRGEMGKGTVDGAFRISDPDGLNDLAKLSITVGGTTTTLTMAELAAGNVNPIVGAHGSLSITGYDPATGVVTYTYTLTSPVTDHVNNDGFNIEQDKDIFTLTVTDKGGLGASATLKIDIVDDVPSISASAGRDFSVTHDETLLPQKSADDILFTSLFNGVGNPGHDPQSPFGLPLGYARSDSPALSIGEEKFGADGAASTDAKVFSLTLLNAGGLPADGIASGIETTDHHEISLFREGDLIVGRYDHDNNPDTEPVAAFAIHIDAATGIVSLVQYVSLFHTDDTNSNDILSLGNIAGHLQATVTITDGDGDTASASADIGGSIQFRDDGPTLVVGVTRGFGVTADESASNQNNDVTGPLSVFAHVQNQGQDPDRDNNPLAFAQSKTSAVTYVPYFGVDGPAAANPVTYGLKLGGQGNGIDSGLKLTDGTTISLHSEVVDGNTIIVGRVDGNGPHAGEAAFALAIDPANGKISVVEYLSLQHNPNGFDPNDQVSLKAGTVLATVTITDGDGDTASDSADISGKVHFNDDAPTLVAGGVANITIDEGDIFTALSHGTSPNDGNQDGSDTEAGTGGALASGSIAAAVDFGADSAAAGGGFSFVANAGDKLAAMGLTSNHADLTYQVANGVLTATADGRTVFTLKLSGDGSFEFRLFDQLDHVAGDGHNGKNTELAVKNGGSISSIDFGSVIQATDGDNDSVTLSGKLNITVTDDVPQVDALPVGTTSTPVTYSILDSGNILYRAVQGEQDFDLLLTGKNSGGVASVNTNSSGTGSANVGTGSGIEASETLRIDFMKGLTTIGNVNSGTYAADERFSANSFTFSASKVHGNPNNTVNILVQLFSVNANDDLNTNNGAVDFSSTGTVTISSITINGGTPIDLATLTQVGGGYVLTGIKEGDKIVVNGSSAFGRVEISNNGGGESFSVGGFGAKVETPKVFEVRHDETYGVNTGADTNAADDTAASLPPALTAAIGGLTELGHAVTTASASGLFTYKPGADETATVGYTLTNATGGAFNGVDSGLTTTEGGQKIYLYSEGNVLWGVAGGDLNSGTKVFAAYVDPDGRLWLVQFEAIAHPVAGSDASAHDDAVSVGAEIRIAISVTDADGDTVTKHSDEKVKLTFQDDGPIVQNAAFNLPEGQMTSGQLSFDTGRDGGGVTHINGKPLTFTDGWSQWVSDAKGNEIRVTAAGAYEFRAHADDVYKTGGVATFTYTVKDGDGDTADGKVVVTVTDDSDPVTATLTATASTGEDGGEIIYTVTLTGGPGAIAPKTDLVFKLANGEEVKIAAGATSGSTTITVDRDDVYKEADSVSNSISSVKSGGGEYESLVLNPEPVSTTITDDSDPVTATLTAGEATLGVNGVSVTYTVTLTGGPGAIGPKTDLVLKLANGEEITVQAGETSGFVVKTYAYGSFSGTTITNSISGITSGGSEYENLETAGATSVTANTVPTGGGSVSLMVDEAALDMQKDGKDLKEGTATGTHPSSTNETDQTSSGITFNATGEAITVGFPNPSMAGSGWVAPTVSGLAAGYSISWAWSGGMLVGTLMEGTGQAAVNHGEAILLALSGTLAAGAGGSVTPTVTATLTGPLAHAAGNGDVTISGVKVVATDSSGDIVSANVNLTVHDDAPENFTAASMRIVNGADAEGHGALHFFENIGADGGKSPVAVVFQGTNGSDLASQLGKVMSGGEQVKLYGFGTDSLIAKTGADANGNGGKLIFEVHLNPDASSASNDYYSIKFHEALDDGSQVTLNPTSLSGVKSGSAAFNIVLGSDGQDLLISTATRGSNGSLSSGTVNISGQGVGVNSNHVYDNSIVRFDFVSGASVGNGNNNTYDYSSHYKVNAFTFVTNSASSGTEVWIRTYNSAATNVSGTSAQHQAALIGNRSEAIITGVVINGQEVALSSLLSDGHGGYLIEGLSTGSRVQIISSGGFNQLEVENVSSAHSPFTSSAQHPLSLNGEDFLLSVAGYSVLTGGQGKDLNLGFTVKATDSDGDTATGTIGVTTLHPATEFHGTNGDDVLVGGLGNDTLVGGLGDDILVGGGGDDILIGGPGHNTLTGGAGDDTFVLDSSALVGGPSMADIIVDYHNSTTEHDVVDLTALLDDIGANQVNDYVKVVHDTANAPAGGPQDALQVNTGSGFVTVAWLDANAGVKILYNDDQHHAHDATVTK
ncbi:MAG: DUF5801 repeats-in-toxin domain-containing protein [Shinella zoogloeoides]|uniref:DUF5801 repeats-in-toxin domain-containing protein n=1 Tax=Shinella zoogloeoides TaxID=352475 RepID=UPI003C730ABC